MANKEKIDYLLLDIRELEKSVAGMRDAGIYPASFFSETFQLTHKIVKELHSLEEHQIETLRRQMEEHQRLIASIPVQRFYQEPEHPQPVVPSEPEVIEEKVEVIEEKVIETPLIKQEAPIEEKTAIIEEVIAKEEPIAVEKPVIKEELIAVEKPVAKETPIIKETPLIKEEPIHIPQPEKSYQEILSEKQGISLNEILERQNLSDFRKAFSLNDRFRFRRELFGGDEEKMNKAITELNDIHSYEESVTYLNNVLQWNVEDVSVADFIKLLEKRFS